MKSSMGVRGQCRLATAGGLDLTGAMNAQCRLVVWELVALPESGEPANKNGHVASDTNISNQILIERIENDRAVNSAG